MIKDKCIECKSRESRKKQLGSRPFEHLYCDHCWEGKNWNTKYLRERPEHWFRVMFDRSIKEDERNNGIINMIYN